MIFEVTRNVSTILLAVDNPFYRKEYSGTSNRLVFKDALFKLKETVQFGNLLSKTEARWTLS